MVTSIKGAFLSPTGRECKVLNDAQRAYHATTFLLKNCCTVKNGTVSHTAQREDE